MANQRKTVEDRLFTEDVMRGAVARAGMLLQVTSLEAISTGSAVVLTLFAVYLVTAIETAAAYAFATFTIAGMLGIVAKGAFMLHRKWTEYAGAEYDSEREGGWKNPSRNVSQQNKLWVGVSNGIAIAAIPLPVLFYSYYQLYFLLAPVLYYMVVFYSLSLSVVCGIAWGKASST